MKEKIHTMLVGKEVTIIKPRHGDPQFGHSLLTQARRGVKATIANVYLSKSTKGNPVVCYDLLMPGGNLWEDVSPSLFRLGEIITADSSDKPCVFCNAMIKVGEQITNSGKGWCHHGCAERASS